MNWRSTAFLVFLMPVIARAQTDLQKFALDQVSFQYRSDNDDPRRRCLVWYPLSSDRPSVQYDDNGSPFLVLRVKARSRKNCSVKFSPANVITEVEDSEAANRGDRLFDVVVRPPVAAARADGPDFHDDLIFEAPLRKFGDLSFFDFFRRSRVYFESRYASLSTDNTVNPIAPQKVFPVFGGSLSFPMPFVPFIFLGYSMFQNLGNFAGKQDNPVQYSEFSFDARLVWGGPRAWGSPYASLAGEYRGRSVYQLSEKNRSFLIGASSLPGWSVEFGAYPGNLFVPGTHWVSRLGFDVALRGSLSAGAQQSYKSSLVEGALNYRFSPKWAVGVGYSKIAQEADFTSRGIGIVHEGVSQVFLRLTLLNQQSEGN